jgi:hypothetical protein
MHHPYIRDNVIFLFVLFTHSNEYIYIYYISCSGDIMFDLIKKDFVFSQSDGQLWSFFYNRKDGLCFSRYFKSSGWDSPFTIKADASSNFSAEMLNDNTFHIIYQDLQGNILHSHISGFNMDTACILNSRDAISYDKHLRIFHSNDHCGMLFVIKKAQYNVLSYQPVIADESHVPTAIDYIVPGIRPYQIYSSFDGKLNLFYHLKSQDGGKIGYRVYSPESKKWNDFRTLVIENRPFNFVDAIVDPSSNAHILLQIKDRDNYSLLYAKRNMKMSTGNEIKTLASSTIPFNNCTLFFRKNLLVVYYVVENEIKYCVSDNYGSSWSAPYNYQWEKINSSRCVYYKVNSDDTRNFKIGTDLPALYSQGIKVAFQDNFHELSQRQYSENKITQPSSMESTSDLKRDLLQMQNKYQTLERELQKIRIELNSFKRGS